MRKSFLIIFLCTGSVSQAVEKVTSKKTTVASATISISTPATAIPDRTLKYYEIGKTDGPVLFTQKIQYQKLASSNMTSKSVVTDPQGNVMFTETIVYQGSSPISQVSDVTQTKRHLELEVKDQHIYFKTRAIGLENTEVPKESVESLPEHFLTGALAESFILEHFSELMAGDTIHTKMGIMEVREILSFKFWKKEMSTLNGREVMVVAMKPSSIFISLMLDTIYLYIDTKDKKMVHYVGRTPLWKDVDGKLKALDAEIVVE